MLPVESSRQVEGLSATLILQVNPDLFWYEGHFAAFPLLPGVAQLDWVMHYARELLVPEKNFAGLENLKFQRPVPPGATLQLDLSWQPQKSRLTFSYSLLTQAEPQRVSSGNIQLC